MALTYSQMLPLGTDFPKFKLYNVINDKQFNSDDYEIKDRSEEHTSELQSHS